MKNIVWILLFGILKGKVLIRELIGVFFFEVCFLVRRLKEFILSVSILEFINKIRRFFPKHGEGVTSLLISLVFFHFIKINQIIGVLIGHAIP
jgi:hypothetical protein